MKPATAFSFLAFALTTTVYAIPTPDAPVDPAVTGTSTDALTTDDPDQADPEKRGFMFGPLKLNAGTNGIKRDNNDDVGDVAEIDIDADADAGDVEKRGFMFGPLKLNAGTNGIKRDTDENGEAEVTTAVPSEVGEDADADTEDVEKRGFMFGPLKLNAGTNGIKRRRAQDFDA